MTLQLKPTDYLLFALIFIGITACKNKTETPQVPPNINLQYLYDQYNVNGTFVLYDQNKDEYTFHHPEAHDLGHTPASTFKICNTLIGLETGIIPDENFVLPWDSTIRLNDEWNRDHSLKSAFKYSTVWYYQELARRVGYDTMKYWVEAANYGNKNIEGEIDHFWLTGSLKISPAQQIDFLKHLYHNELPFSERSMVLTKEIMLVKQTDTYTLSAKTGWGVEDSTDIGWYVGYVETDDNVYFFANCIQNGDFMNQYFSSARTDITYAILDTLGITK